LNYFDRFDRFHRLQDGLFVALFGAFDEKVDAESSRNEREKKKCLDPNILERIISRNGGSLAYH
jgi:hypothetical protein